MVIRNGCAGGILKEVLDYSAQKTNQVQFISHQEQAAVNLPQVDQQYLDSQIMQMFQVMHLK